MALRVDKALTAAAEGTWHRLAQGVRSKEEPEETFLKSVPSDMERLEIIYPVSGMPIDCAPPRLQ